MIPHIPDHAPFSTEQRSWLNGFFAGLYSLQNLDAQGACPIEGASARAAPYAGRVTVLYGSQTGTAEGLARKASKRLAEAGLQPDTKPLDDCTSTELPAIERLLVITSTYGDGEMPDNAQLFWDDLTSAGAPALGATAFSVLALGDSSYPDYCQAGKDIDARLEALGARRISARVDCDVDVDEPFEAWMSAVLASLTESVALATAA